MNLPQAIEHANAFVFPAFLTDDEARTHEREKNEEALSVLMETWWSAPAGAEPFSFDLVRSLADRNRELCDLIGEERLRELRGTSLAQRLSDDDIIRGAAVLQHRPLAEVRKTAGAGLRDMGAAYVEAPVSGMVCGVDIETTSRMPDRGYIINVGMQFVKLAPKGVADKGYFAYCGIPQMYEEKGVPLANIHHISWGDLAGKQGFRENRDIQKAMLYALETFPYLAHNAAFEDSWFMLHLNGYAEGRKSGRIVPIDTRDICRRIDPEVRMLPHDAKPAALETWARRRKTLSANEKERHLGLDDVDLMIRTVEAEFAERNMFAEDTK
ncbi:MAG: 3'-5' exonuclease [Coriobacteriales bacterium]|nr:3'-5' exonuclease [Coriobacteriales bacterium]